jgi:hypothetical protein
MRRTALIILSHNNCIYVRLRNRMANMLYHHYNHVVSVCVKLIMQ